METFIERFEQFKKIIVYSNVPNKVLLELLESYMQSYNEESKFEPTPVFEGQLSLFDLAN